MSPTSTQKNIEGGVSTKEYFVFRNKDSFFRNAFGQLDLHLALRAVCVFVGGISALTSVIVFVAQAFSIIPVAVDPVPFFYNGLLFMGTAIGDSWLQDGQKKNHRK